jgi:hypothetical protein
MPQTALAHRRRALNEELSGSKHRSFNAMAAVVALLFLNFMDQRFNEVGYTRAAVSIVKM